MLKYAEEHLSIMAESRDSLSISICLPHIVVTGAAFDDPLQGCFRIDEPDSGFEWIGKAAGIPP